jgi:hypothetical protein
VRPRPSAGDEAIPAYSSKVSRKDFTQLCREDLGVRSTVIPINRRGQGRKWPLMTYRRQMKRRRRKYGQRWAA